MNNEEKKAIEWEKNNLEQTIELGKKYGLEEAIKNHTTILNLIEKQQKEIEDLKELNKGNKKVETDYISKEKIKEVLGIEEDISEEKLLNLLETLMSEVDRLEDIEDKKVQIEYELVFNKGVKSVEDKIIAKIEKLKEIHKERDFTNKEAFYLDCYEELLGKEE